MTDSDSQSGQSARLGGDTDTSPEGIQIPDSALLNREPVPELIIVTGMSGAGRSRAAMALEDLDWYVVDNLPPKMLPAFAGMMTPDGGGVHQLAAVVDVRSQKYFKDLEEVLVQLRTLGVAYRIIFLEASDRELVRRFETNRRPHPLQRHGRILDALAQERALLEPLRKQADQIIDTTALSVHDLARAVAKTVTTGEERKLRLTVMSFGFKYGIPVDADHVVDMRFLANPYWVPQLRHHTGLDEGVREYVLGLPGATDFLQGWINLFTPILNRYISELKPYVTIAVGCTGGKHRSVVSAEYISQGLLANGYAVTTVHRDMGKE
ncbi:RNase adapter RapZ [Boudabousia marimammalium]|uniref:RNase adaptor protein RapZ n=1 Tax=Boudabousia marimammalium TaxID=156892 RepID=A0A1Q5PRG1_9ACTO|nr:RNase adapter RapZ [Boudabousia marimammalium]OKL50025.1 RNase adaptor protein RapZ [Boudabousia marimammalium]